MNHMTVENGQDFNVETDAFLLATMMEKRKQADAIEQQLTEDVVSGYVKGEVWRSKARKARQHLRADALGIHRELDRRRIQRDQDIRMTRARELGRAQEGQHALFVRYMSTTMPKDQWVALWVKVCETFPNDPAWLNGSSAS